MAESSCFDMDPNPFLQFERWYADACGSSLSMPNAMTLATVDEEGHPNARMVLLKGFSDHGFDFFTNRLSPKGRELAVTPYASLVFWWEPLSRQVRIRGPVSQQSDQESDTYYQSRDRGSRIGAWASQQSSLLSGREELEASVKYYQLKFGDGPIPRPPYWGGFRLSPTAIEFWQEQPFRLHDRMRYRKVHHAWIQERLSP